MRIRGRLQPHRVRDADVTATPRSKSATSVYHATDSGQTRLRFNEEQMLDLVATVGNYHLVAMFLNSTGAAPK